MKYIKGYQSHRDLSPVNEEFIGGLLKGALSKLMAAFSGPFKDLANDFKNQFKQDDPNSIKQIIMTNLNQAIDSSQKLLSDTAVDEAGVNDVINQLTTKLVELANGLDKDIDTAIGKDKSAGAKAIAKSIILGNKEAKWAGIVGLIDSSKGLSGIKTTYKYSKTEYEKILTDVGSKAGANGLKARKDASTKFLDNLQKDLQVQLDKEFTDEEVKKAYEDAMKNAKQGVEYKVDDNVIYLLKDKKKEDWDKLSDEQKKLPNEAPANTLVGVHKISKIEGDNFKLLDKDGNPTIVKTKADIIGKSEVNEGEEAKKAAESLGKIKNDPAKMKKVANFADFLQDEANKDKVTEIETIIGGEKTAEA